MKRQESPTSVRLPRELRGYIADSAAKLEVPFNQRIVGMLNTARSIEEGGPANLNSETLRRARTSTFAPTPAFRPDPKVKGG